MNTHSVSVCLGIQQNHTCSSYVWRDQRVLNLLSDVIFVITYMLKHHPLMWSSSTMDNQNVMKMNHITTKLGKSCTDISGNAIAKVLFLARCRMIVTRRRFLRQRMLAIKIQSHIRGYTCRKCTLVGRAICNIKKHLKGISDLELLVLRLTSMVVGIESSVLHVQ